MKFENLLELMLFPLVSFVSCMPLSEPAPDYAPQSYEGVKEMVFSTELSGMEEVVVKSVLPEETIETKITSVTLASYGNDGFLVDARYYESTSSGMILNVAGDGMNHVYALVNMGDMTGRFPKAEADVSGMEYVVFSYADIESNGIPMSGMLDDVRPDATGGIIPVDRLFAKLNIRILHTGLDNSSPNALFAFNMCNKSLYIRQANSRLLPFSEKGSRAVTSADILDEADRNENMNDRNAYEGSLGISSLGPGPGYFQDSTFVFYVPENVQGVLLPGNSDPFGKVYGEIEDIDGVRYSDICTYVEFNAFRENTNNGYSGGVMYRYYLGADNVSDFSIERNKRYDMTLNFSEKGFLVDSWKVTRGEDWSDMRELYFLEDPYVVYQGGSENVVIHYSRRNKARADSDFLPDEWDISYDEAAAAKAGLTCVVDKSALYTGENGCSDFRMTVKASENATVGAVVPLEIVSWDGALIDRAVINVSRLGAMAASWDFCPEYVSQYGTFDVSGVPADKMPLKVSVSDARVARCEVIDGDTFKVVAVGPGNAVVNISNSDGTQTLSLPLSVKTPVLKLTSIESRMTVDGSPVYLDYEYFTYEGETLGEVDADVYENVLRPVAECDGYFSFKAANGKAELWVSRLYVNGAQLSLGTNYRFRFVPSGCAASNVLTYLFSVADPFSASHYSGVDYGELHDYTLMGLSGVPQAVRRYFADELNSGHALTLSVAPVDLDPAYVDIEMLPAWTGGFSNANEVYSVNYNASSGTSIGVVRNAVTTDTKHSAGKHNLRLSVRNRYSNERISVDCGWIDVYVHAALGAVAEFGMRQCCSDIGSGGETFAGLYNSVAGRNVFPENSTDYVHYMDVSLEWMTDISNVYVLDRMTKAAGSGGNQFDALDIVRPAMADGAVDNVTKLVYSVYSPGADARVMAGEESGLRKGIGVMLYRALWHLPYDYGISQTFLNEWFFGYSVATGKASRSHAPSFTLHDMNISADMSKNIVLSNDPYYYSPSSCMGYTDDDGRGYHVIHFVDEIAPETCGWTNLL